MAIGETPISAPIQPVTYDSSMISMTPVGNTYRSVGASWFNKGDIAREDWQRTQQADQNAFIRDMIQQQDSQRFTAAENQKQRDFEERLSNSEYQRVVQDLKLAGLNPILAYNNGGASTPAHTVSTSHASPASRGNRDYKGGDDNGAFGKLLAIILTTAGKIIGGGQGSSTSTTKPLGFGSW